MSDTECICMSYRLNLINYDAALVHLWMSFLTFGIFALRYILLCNILSFGADLAMNNIEWPSSKSAAVAGNTITGGAVRHAIYVIDYEEETMTMTMTMKLAIRNDNRAKVQL